MKQLIFILLIAGLFAQSKQKSDSAKVYQQKQIKVIMTKLDSIIVKLDSIKAVKDSLNKRRQ